MPNDMNDAVTWAWNTATNNRLYTWNDATTITASQWVTTNDQATIAWGRANVTPTIRVNRSDAWSQWIVDGHISYSNTGNGVYLGQEDEDARIRRLAVQSEQAEMRQIAAARAVELLLGWLDESQKREFELHRRFTIVVPSGRRYQINHGRSGNVYEIDERGRPLAKWCGHPADYVPDEDTMLAQKLMLECDEDGFLRMANLHHRWSYPDDVAA